MATAFSPNSIETRLKADAESMHMASDADAHQLNLSMRMRSNNGKTAEAATRTRGIRINGKGIVARKGGGNLELEQCPRHLHADPLKVNYISARSIDIQIRFSLKTSIRHVIRFQFFVLENLVFKFI